jgi:ribonuclease P protein subunit POP4
MHTKNALKEELIGRDIIIIHSKNPTLKGIEGKIVDETQKTLKILCGKKTITTFKKDLIFEAKKDDKTSIIEGKNIQKRPEERIKGK